MSDTTLYSGLYQQLSEYAELVDDVLLTVVGNNREKNVELYKRLGGLLESLVTESEGRLSTKIIAQLLRENDDVVQNELSEITQGLQNGKVDEITRDVLERFARLLEQERTILMSRIRGERR